MAVRLYIDAPLQPQAKIEVDDKEWAYFTKVRRQQGPIILFNRQGQEAEARLEGRFFVVETIRSCESKIAPVDVAVALPEHKVISDLIPALSESGARSLILFPAARSQAGRHRLKDSTERWTRLALESSRQCARGIPLEILRLDSLEEVLRRPASCRIVLDESSEVEAYSPLGSPPASDVLVVVGCEGGWVQEERELFQSHNCHICHFETPILKVGTAVIAGYFAVLQKFFPARLRWSFESRRVVDRHEKRS